ncbi:golgin subfamily A member 6-like protein 7 isoform X4 [Dysidea avara]|uniref:golgin subfamily A member 6-like protein 7 isoform X4 n=1 Tax=Dysidea avara TaxID=196820 RepID=UPI00331D9FEB
MSSLSTWINWIKGLWDTQSRPHSHDGGESGQSGELIKDNTSGQEPTAVETPTNDLTSIAVGDIEQQFHSKMFSLAKRGSIFLKSNRTDWQKLMQSSMARPYLSLTPSSLFQGIKLVGQTDLLKIPKHQHLADDYKDGAAAGSQKGQELKSYQDELEQEHNRANNFRRQLEAMTNEKELLSAKLVQLQRDNDAAQLTITQKGEEVNCYQKNQEKLQAQLIQLTEWQSKHETVLMDLSQKEEKLKSCQEELKQRHKSADNFQSQLKAMTNKKESLSVQLEQLQTDNDAAQVTIAQKDEEVNKSQEKLQAQLKQLTEEQNKYEAVLKDLSQKEQELKSYQEELKQCHKSADNFQSQFKAMTNEKELLSVQLEQLQTDTQIAIAQKDEEVNKSQEDLQAQLKQLTEEQNKYEAVLKDLSQKEQELKSCQEELKQCHKSANNFQSQLEAMTNEKELLSVQLAQLHRNNDAAQLTIRKKDEELKCYQNNLDKPQAQLIEWKNKYEAVFKDLSQKEEELKSCQEELKQCHKKLLEMEEVSFQLTNSFTTADSRSPLILSQEYRNIQHNCRPAASRAHRKTYNGCDSVPFEKHTMVAYKEAKHQVLTALQNHIERSLFIMQKEDECASQIPKCVKLMLNKLYTDHSLTKDPVEAIVEVLCKEYRDHVDRKDADIPPQVHEYYEKLADFTWTTVTKAIPMVLSTDKDQYDNEIHELIDDDETDEAVSSAKFTYIYPTLFTSNSWPREVALKGRIKFVDM